MPWHGPTFHPPNLWRSNDQHDMRALSKQAHQFSAHPLHCTCTHRWFPNRPSTPALASAMALHVMLLSPLYAFLATMPPPHYAAPLQLSSPSARVDQTAQHCVPPRLHAQCAPHITSLTTQPSWHVGWYMRTSLVMLVRGTAQPDSGPCAHKLGWTSEALGGVSELDMAVKQSTPRQQLVGQLQ